MAPGARASPDLNPRAGTSGCGVTSRLATQSKRCAGSSSRRLQRRLSVAASVTPSLRLEDLGFCGGRGACRGDAGAASRKATEAVAPWVARDGSDESALLGPARKLVP